MSQDVPVRKKPQIKIVNQIKRPFDAFFAQDISGGILLILATLLALIWANSEFAGSYFALLDTPISLKIANLELSNTLSYWIKDVLMTIFFFLVGLEIKKELAIGQLSDFSKASLPMIAAVGGMVVPAVIYVYFNTGTESLKGWGIPMATDIAFAVGVLALLGKKIPLGLRIFLLALAIVDDLGAVLVIAFFYSSGVSTLYLTYAVVTLLAITTMAQAGVRSIIFYVIAGIFLWFFFHESGIHSTVAGVILGLMTPYYRIEEEENAPLDRLANSLHPWVNYFIMPVFAFANAGLVLKDFSLSSVFSNPISLGIVFGLLLGKPIGVIGFSYLAVKLKISKLPDGVDWKFLTGAGLLAGIGFTMSLFVSALAFGHSQEADVAKIGIFVGSILAGVLGYIVLFMKTKNSKVSD